MKLGVSVATYNTGLIRAQVAGYTLFEFAPHVEVRSRHISNAVLDVNPDIVCLQEVFSRKHLRIIASDLNKTYPYSYAPLSFRPKLFDSGLSLFSKYPILQSNFYWFRSQLMEEALFAPKSYMAVTIDTGTQGLIEIVNSHTTAGGSRHHPESQTADNCRQLQLEEMIEFLMQRDASIAHSLLVGDLNCGPEASKSNYEFLLSRGFTDLPSIAYSSSVAPVTWEPENPLNAESPHKTSPPQRIDHILASSRSRWFAEDYKAMVKKPTVQLSTDVRCTPSDHYGVLVSLRSGI